MKSIYWRVIFLYQRILIRLIDRNTDRIFQYRDPINDLPDWTKIDGGARTAEE